MRDEKRTGVLDTHPAPRDRLKAVRAAGEPGVFHLEYPAKVLIQDFDKLCRVASDRLYQLNLGPAYETVEPVPTATLLARFAPENKG
jgi:hypothetical protein